MSGAEGSPLVIAPNVRLDSASAHAWLALNERVFLERFFAALAQRLDGFVGYTFFVFSPAHAATRPASADLAGAGKILIFLSDESSSIPHALTSQYHAIFKAYLPHELPGTNIFPFSLGYVGDAAMPEPVGVLDRPYDAFFSGNLNTNRVPLYQAFHPELRRLPPIDGRLLRLVLRTPLGSLLRRDFGVNEPGFRSYVAFTDGFKTGLAPAEYQAMLSRSKIVLCPRGFTSTETFRHVEALRAGAIVVSEPLPDTRFYRGSPIITVANWPDGLRQIRALAVEPHRLAELQMRSRAWYHDVLSEDATARFVATALGSEGLSTLPAVL